MAEEEASLGQLRRSERVRGDCGLANEMPCWCPPILPMASLNSPLAACPSPLTVHPLCTIPGKLAVPILAPDGTAIVCDRNAPPKPTTMVDGVLWHHCRFCEHAAKRKDNIKTHEAAHLGDKAFECQYCDDTFTQKNHLVHHERTHTGERPFECQYCDDTFTRRHYLVDHERTHTGEQPHGCGECGARFTLRAQLVVHLRRTHTGIKPYLCSACDYAAVTSTHVNRHIKRRHPSSGAMYINATGVLEGPARGNKSAPPAHTCDPSLPTEGGLAAVVLGDTVASASTPATTALAPEAPLPCPDIDVMDPGQFVRGSLLRLLHATPEQQAALLATEEYRHLRGGCDG